MRALCGAGAGVLSGAGRGGARLVPLAAPRPAGFAVVKRGLEKATGEQVQGGVPPRVVREEARGGVLQGGVLVRVAAIVVDDAEPVGVAGDSAAAAGGPATGEHGLAGFVCTSACGITL